VLASDLCLSLSKAWVFSVPESRDPAVGGPDPTQRGPRPVPGVQVVAVRVLDLPGGPVYMYRDPALSHGVRTHC
jgi:hypothetical protein